MKSLVFIGLVFLSKSAMAADLACDITETFKRGTAQETYKLTNTLKNDGATVETNAKYVNGLKVRVDAFVTKSGQTQLTASIEDALSHTSSVVALPAPSRFVTLVFTRAKNAVALVCAISQ